MTEMDHTTKLTDWLKWIGAQWATVQIDWDNVLYTNGNNSLGVPMPDTN